MGLTSKVITIAFMALLTGAMWKFFPDKFADPVWAFMFMAVSSVTAWVIVTVLLYNFKRGVRPPSRIFNGKIFIHSQELLIYFRS